MKKRPLLLIILVIITTLTLFAFPGAGSATDYVPNTTYTHYSIISSPFNEPITIEKNYNNYADALSAAKNMAHVAMYREDVQSKIATLSNEEFINYLYDGLFHRTPEEAEFAGWLVGLNNGWSRSDAIDYFINSPEFEMSYVYGDALSAAKNMAHVAMYGEDVQSKIATLTNEEFINYLYGGLFHRTPEEAGFAGWLVGLNEDLSRSSMIDYFINSPEFEMRYVYGYSMPPAAVAAAVVVPLVIDDGNGNDVTINTTAIAGVTVAAPLAIGDSYQGGKVAYILVSGDLGYDASVQHGLIAATADQSTGIVWVGSVYYSALVPGGTSTALGSGAANTTKIITQNGAGNYDAGLAGSYAASLARKYTDGDYHDWYLPSKDELNKLYLSRWVVGGFAFANYWSSSEYNNSNAWNQYFYDGYQYSYSKNFTDSVRAVRAF